ncbi:hypothetical protein N7499_002561 [Penicillium canescens]|nr:hypothetical protein N7499_002561 [Penicillium canescens]KAJ6166176.1 hypothetical protein N7485_009420 [Penicillium canescens]
MCEDAYELLPMLLQAGADFEARDRAGRTVLFRHIDSIQISRSNPTLFQTLIDLGARLNTRDFRGRTLLHQCCHQINRLDHVISLGIDPTLADYEGNTLLIETAASKISNINKFAFLKHLCGLGLDIDQANHGGECAQFEAEQTLWDHIQNAYSYNAAGVLLNDTRRPCSDQDGACSMGNAILELLVLQDPIPLAKSRSFSFAFYEAVSNHHEYTVDCFSRLWTRMCPDIPFNHSNRMEYLTSKYRLEATRQALRGYSKFDDADHPSKSLEFMEGLLFRRQYGILEEFIAKQGDPFRINHDAHSLLHSLVKWGFKYILARVCPRDAILDLDDHEWCQMAEAKASCSQSSVIGSLLVAACLSELPNMSVLEFLVEEIGVNLDIKCRSPSLGIQELIFVPSGGPLHQVAAGGSWWHVAKALPYLIKMGANVELRPFHKDATKLLIEYGADVNAVDARGMTCLAKAGDDLTLLKLLMANGATVTASDIFSAIGLEQVENLEVLLAQGDYANLRMPGLGKICKSGFRGVRIVESEVSPLLHVLGYGTPTMCKPEDVSRGTRMVKTLLNHGADLYAYFSKDVRVLKEGYDEHSNMDESEELDVWEPQTTTVIHEFLRTGLLIEPLFHLPFLDLELRDSSGETLLLAACRSYETVNTEIYCAQGQETVTKTVLQELIDRGADVTARDNYGKNIFHHIGLYYPRNDFAETRMTIIEKNPNLIHQPDLAGDTFFHEILHSYGNTALHYLADELSPDPERKSHFDLFRKFLAAGVDISAKNRKGETPLFRYVLQSSDHWVFPSDEEEPSRPCFDFFA